MYDNVIANGQHKYLPNTINGHEFVVATPYQRPDGGSDVDPGQGLPIVLRGPSTPLGVLPHVDVSGIGCSRQYFFTGTKFQTKNEYKCQNILEKGKRKMLVNDFSNSYLEMSSEEDPIDPGSEGRTKLSSVFKSHIRMLRPSI